MYKFGDIVSYKTKSSKKNVNLVVVSDLDGYINGLTFEKKLKKFKKDPERFLKIPKTVIRSRRFYYVNTRSILDVKTASVSNEELSLSKQSIKELRDKIQYLASKKEFSKIVLSNIEKSDKLAKCGTRTEPLSSELHVPTMNELFPNGTGRTKEEFERDTADVPKKFLLKYKEMISKQQ